MRKAVSPPTVNQHVAAGHDWLFFYTQGISIVHRLHTETTCCILHKLVSKKHYTHCDINITRCLWTGTTNSVSHPSVHGCRIICPGFHMVWVALPLLNDKC